MSLEEMRSQAQSTPDAPLSTVPGVPDTDDIPDVAVPAGALAPLPVDPFADVRQDLRTALAVMDKMCVVVDTRLATVSPAEAGALQHLCEALEGLKGGLLVAGSPYRLTMQALTPQGYPVALTVERQDSAAFFADLASLATWLHGNGYKMPPAAVAF